MKYNLYKSFLWIMTFILFSGNALYATNYVSGLHSFKLVNPPSTRNIIGNYAIAGNTVMCLTEKTSGYGGTCHGQNDYQKVTSNLHVSKYIDIDGNNNGNSATWNSSSSYIQLPANLNTSEGNPVLWAGLFWQGRFSTDTDYVMHYGKENGTTYNLIEMGRGAPGYNEGNRIDISTLGANDIKLKVDSSGYTDTEADTIYTYTSSNGMTYAAYADITTIVQNANLTPGKHTFTVANLTTNEGREASPGVFGGWSLVVIYKEDTSGDARNISIYNGFESIGRNNNPIHISGFKLPETGDVSAQLSVFSGEGEYLYGRTDTSDRVDWMKMSDRSDGGYAYMPGKLSGRGVGNRDNMFDGVMDGVLRDDIPGQSNNLQVNNDGVDIDRYDVSPLMTGYRDNNPDINDVYIKVYSNNDYITPSMFAFSAELYKPNICYDYSVRNDNYTLPSQNREIKTLGNGKLHLNISIRSLEGDFDLQNTTLALDVNPSNKVSFDKALYSKTGTNVMVPAIVTNASKPEIAFGKDVNASGGTLGAFETYFSRFDFDFTSSDYFDGYFDIDLIGYIDFGSGPAPLPLSTKSGTLPRCEQNPVYNPEWGMFNIERLDSGNFNTDRERFPLFTQIAGRDFDFSLVAYDPTDLRHEKTISGYTVDVELIDASPYDDNNSIFTCQNTDPSIIHSNSIFIQFPDSQSKSRINMQDSNDMRINSALKNAAYRMWVLVDENNTIIPHTCTIDDDDCFINTVYQPHLQASDSEGNCANCKSYVNAERGVSGCYACLRDFFGKPYCSRDNFSIRPESYRIAVIDADEHNESSAPKIQIANNNNPTGAILAAEYDYRLEANATTFNSDNIALNYYQELNSTLEFNDLSSCNDTNDSNITYEFRNGQVLYDWKNQLPYNLSHNNVGNYRFHIIDSTWTKVDQKTYRYKRFYSDDCNLGDASTSSDGNTLSGCNTASNFDATHREMNLNFNPYTYDVKGIIISMPNNNNFVYMNDLNTTNIPDRAMAVRFNGPLVARGKSGTQLTNYTASCAAKPVIFDINRTITQNSSPVDKNTIMSIDPDGYLPPEKTSLQRYNSSQDTNTSLSYSKDNNDTNSTFAIRIDSTQFKNENNGSANISLEYNFERKANLVSNPLAVTFNFKEANSTAASSNAHMIANYIPEGNATVNSTVNFIYGRIAASQNTPYIVTPSESQTTIPMFVEGYCSGLAMDGTIMNCALYDLNISSPRDNGQWWVNTKHDSTKGDGQIGSLTDARQGSALSITPNSNIDLNNPTNITVSLPNNIQRPYNTTIVVVPSVPWLGYNPNGVFNPIVNFQGGGGWAGKGNTGMVLDTNASYNPNSKRIEW